MSHESSTVIIDLLLALWPFLLLGGVWLYAMRTGFLRRGAMTQARYMDELLNESRRQNAALSALLAKMDARLSALEPPRHDAGKPGA